jgi:hypothetical protein
LRVAPFGWPGVAARGCVAPEGRAPQHAHRAKHRCEKPSHAGRCSTRSASDLADGGRRASCTHRRPPNSRRLADARRDPSPRALP